MHESQLNISGYCFHPLQDLAELRVALLAKGNELSLKGTILITPEGLNVFLAGPRSAVETFLEDISALTQLDKSRFDYKESFSEGLPFNRFLVKIKKETIAFDKLYNFDQSAPYISPKELEALLNDEEQEVYLLDTRNTYETELGLFEKAIDPKITTFKEFKDKLKNYEHLKDKKIVTYCTGGIRCEKAATYMKEQGFSDVSQLKGGILRYFEEVGGAHYEGECFVFDRRVSLTPELTPSDKKLCYACRAALTTQDYEHEQYKEGEYCPRCINKELSHAC